MEEDILGILSSVPFYTWTCDNDTVYIKISNNNLFPVFQSASTYEIRKSDGHVKKFYKSVLNGVVLGYVNKLVKEYGNFAEFYEDWKTDEKLRKVAEDVSKKLGFPLSWTGKLDAAEGASHDGWKGRNGARGSPVLPPFIPPLAKRIDLD